MKRPALFLLCVCVCVEGEVWNTVTTALLSTTDMEVPNSYNSYPILQPSWRLASFCTLNLLILSFKSSYVQCAHFLQYLLLSAYGMHYFATVDALLCWISTYCFKSFFLVSSVLAHIWTALNNKNFAYRRTSLSAVDSHTQKNQVLKKEKKNFSSLLTLCISGNIYIT